MHRRYRRLRRIGWFAAAIVVLRFTLTGAIGAEQPARITDASGESFLVCPEAKRIVSLAPNITEILFALGLGDSVVGVSSFSNFPPRVQTLPKVGGFARLDIERIISLRPEIAVGTMDGNPARQVRRLRQLGVPVFCIYAKNLSEVLESIRQIGRLFGRSRQAQRLVSTMRAQIEQLRAKGTQLARRLGRPKVLIVLDFEPIVSAGPGTFLHELVETAGGQNIASQSRIRYPRLGMETIVSAAPDVILVLGHGPGNWADQLGQLANWRNIPAVAKRRIHVLDEDLVTRPGPRITEGLRLIQRSLFGKNPDREKVR